MPRPVFAHYMVGGMTAAQAVTDVTEAKAMGFDAFALNIISTDPWSTDAIQFLFQAALVAGFYLFFSFDMLHFTSPSQMLPLIEQYSSSRAYYTYNKKPFISTFYGGNSGIDWNKDLKKALSAKGINIYFIPCFSDALKSPGVDAKSLYDKNPSVDGMFSWDSAWPFVHEGKVNVSSTVDQQYSAGAKSTKKTFMMPISPLQFKHLDKDNNWYRRGELNLAQRIPQILALQPDFVQYLTWNDGGESSYIANVWPDAIGQSVHDYIDGFDHSAWGNIIKPFITAYHAGSSSIADIVPPIPAMASGVFWYRTILTAAACANDPLGKPDGWENAEDVVNVAVLLSQVGAGATVNVYSGGKTIGTVTGVKGMNSWSFAGLQVGDIKVEIKKGNKIVLSATGKKAVTADSATCNYNYQVVGL